jgi:hypothetical protein
MIEDIACFRKGAQTRRFDSQNILNFFQLGSLLDGSDSCEGRIKEVEEDQAEILVIMKSSGRMGVLGRKLFEHGPEGFKIGEALEGVFIHGRHGLGSPETLFSLDRQKPL